MRTILRTWMGVPMSLRWSIWLAGLAVWTYLLCVPIYWLPEFLRPRAGGLPGFIPWGKLLHSCAYASLCGLVPWLTPSAGRRWVLWALLSGHTLLTEYVQ